MFTNLPEFGGYFESVLDDEFKYAKSVRICCGYVSPSTIGAFKDRLIKIAANGGSAILLVGLATWEPFSSKQEKALLQLNHELERLDAKSGVLLSFRRRYHGKVYQFFWDHQHDVAKSSIYAGSSNFSLAGLSGIIECTLPVQEAGQKQQIHEFMNYLCSSSQARNITKIDYPTDTRPRIIKSGSEKLWNQLQRCAPSTFNTSTLPKVEIPLDPGKHHQSGLNVYFGTGRENKVTGQVTPRTWYEVEVNAGRAITSLPEYPKGPFTGKTDDGLVIPMVTNGDYCKNLRSKGGLDVLGRWLKGKLEHKGLLKLRQPVDREMLEDYGTDKLTLYKISKDEYFMQF